MTEFRVGKQFADRLYQADTINIHESSSDVDRLHAGIRLFHEGDFGSAAGNFREFLSTTSGTTQQTREVRFLLALAMLDGHRPMQFSRQHLESVDAHLKLVRELPVARLLSAVLWEDHYRAWQSTSLPAEVETLVAEADLDLLRVIDRCIQATENRIMQRIRHRTKEDI